MTGLEVVLLGGVVCLAALCMTQFYFNIKHAVLILKITEAIESSLDLLDERYDSINQILQIPLFFDSPQIRQVLEDVEASRDAILTVANYMVVEEDADVEQSQ